MDNTEVISNVTRKQRQIFVTLCGLRNLPKVTVKQEKSSYGINAITISHEQQFVPDFRFEWCSQKEHYRVYILVGSTDYDKRKAGYSICTVGSGLTAMGFGVLYAFLHKNRANNKES